MKSSYLPRIGSTCNFLVAFSSTFQNLADNNRLELLPFPVDRFSKPACVPRTAIYKIGGRMA